MARDTELALAGLMLATFGVFLSDPLPTLSEINPDKISIIVDVYVYVYFLITPLTFYLNTVSLFIHVTALEPPIPVFLKHYLPRAGRVVTLVNLLLCAPLLVHVSVAEQSAGFAVSAILVLVSLVFILAFVFKNVLIPNCHAAKGFMPAMFALCITTGTMISLDPILLFTNKNHYDSLIPTIPIHLLVPFLSFSAFILSILLLLVYVRAQSDGIHVTIHAKNLVICPLCVAMATILVYWYVIVYMTVTAMVPFQGKMQKYYEIKL